MPSQKQQAYHELSDGRCARDLAIGLWRRTREIGEEEEARGIARLGDMWEGMDARHRIAEHELLSDLNPVDRLKVYDVQDEILDGTIREAPASPEELREVAIRERKRAIRRRSNYATILTEEASGSEQAALQWLTQVKRDR